MMTEPSEFTGPPAGDTSTVAGGFGLGLLLQLIQIPFTPLMLGWPLIGLTQFAYMTPAMRMAVKAGKHNRKKGLVIAASVVAMLNVTCWGALGIGYFWNY
jgi:hypothetical protein